MSTAVDQANVEHGGPVEPATQPTKLVGSFSRKPNHATLATATPTDAGRARDGDQPAHVHDVLSHCSKKDFFFSREPIGKGAYGVVYKAVDQRSGQTVAIKQLKVEGCKKQEVLDAMRELKLMQRLRHPNVVQFLDSFETNSYIYVVMEYVENGSLAHMIKPQQFGKLSEGLAAKYTYEILLGLQYLHSKGIIHRDIKSANLLLTKDGKVKVADFGLAKVLEQGFSRAWSAKGTPFWMAPETITGKGTCLVSDIWSVGCVIIELVTGVPPWYSKDRDCGNVGLHVAMMQIVEEPHPPLPKNASDILTEFLLSCFIKDTKQRPPASQLLRHEWLSDARKQSRESRAHAQYMQHADRQADAEAEELRNRVGALRRKGSGVHSPDSESSARGSQSLCFPTSAAESPLPAEEARAPAKSTRDHVSHGNDQVPALPVFEQAPKGKPGSARGAPPRTLSPGTMESRLLQEQIGQLRMHELPKRKEAP